jgi:hypothetical protein
LTNSRLKNYTYWPNGLRSGWQLYSIEQGDDPARKMKDLSAIRARYTRDPLPVRLGGLAADLAHITSFSQNPANLAPMADLIREAAHLAQRGGG